MPGIRNYNWESVLDSCRKATSVDFEMIFVGPYDPPDSIKSQVKFIRDFGNPSRCAQICLLHSEGEYILWGSDDCLFVENAIDQGFEQINQLSQERNNIISFVYTEGCSRYHASHWYIKLGDCTSEFIPDNYVVVMNALVKREYLLGLGGWDCRFEAWALGNVDLGIRMQRDGSNVVLGDRLLICSHLPSTSGDHAPIHFAQMEHDKPLFDSIYYDTFCLSRTKVDINNWSEQSSVWNRRFQEIQN